MTHPRSTERVFHELLERTGIDPLDSDFNRRYANAQPIAKKFVEWAHRSDIPPVHVDKNVELQGHGTLKREMFSETPRIVNAIRSIGRKKHDTPTREEHGHDNSHEAHDHGHAKGNLLLPHFGIKKVYHPPEVSTSTYRNLWPVASSANGLPIFPINTVWLIGETFGDQAGRVGLFDNRLGTVNMSSFTIRDLPELGPDFTRSPDVIAREAERYILPITLSSTSILAAAAHYAVSHEKPVDSF